MLSRSYSIRLNEKNKVKIESNHHIKSVLLKSFIIKLPQASTSDILRLQFINMQTHIYNPDEFTINGGNNVLPDTINVVNDGSVMLSRDNYIDYVIYGGCFAMRDNSRFEYKFRLALLDDNMNEVQFNTADLVIEVIHV